MVRLLFVLSSDSKSFKSNFKVVYHRDWIEIHCLSCGKSKFDSFLELPVSEEVNEEIDGGKLLLLFRSVGMNVRMKTKINVEQDGKFVSLSDKLSNKPSSELDDER